MINYIKYTINGETYSLINNGDGTWSKDADAPSVAGSYDLLLEIGEDETKIYLDSTDPRYSFYLELIEEIERKANLIEYLPNVIQDILEFNVIFDAENIELDRFYNAIQQTRLDIFIRTASADKIARLETFLRFKGIGTLEQRRDYLLALFRKGKKLNERVIKEIANTITGSDCIVTFYGADELNNPEPGFGLLLVQVLSPDNNKDYRYADIFRTLDPLVPEHIKLLVVKYFATWEDVKNNFSDWNAIAGMVDWETVKNYIPPQ